MGPRAVRAGGVSLQWGRLACGAGSQGAEARSEGRSAVCSPHRAGAALPPNRPGWALRRCVGLGCIKRPKRCFRCPGGALRAGGLPPSVHVSGVRRWEEWGYLPRRRAALRAGPAPRLRFLRVAIGMNAAIQARLRHDQQQDLRLRQSGLASVIVNYLLLIACSVSCCSRLGHCLHLNIYVWLVFSRVFPFWLCGGCIRVTHGFSSAREDKIGLLLWLN